MFSDLKKGSLVHVLDLRDTPKYYTATVQEVSAPYFPAPKPGMFNPVPGQQYININIDGSEPWGVPANNSVVSRDKLTVSMTRDGLLPALTAAQKESTDIVQSYERHKSALAAYEEITRQLDPSYAASKAQDDRIRGLEERIEKIPTLEDIKALFEKMHMTTAKTQK